METCNAAVEVATKDVDEDLDGQLMDAGGLPRRDRHLGSRLARGPDQPAC
jgi:hypothetical protein